MNKVVLISQQGNGSNLFRELCNSHPDIYFYNEVFLHDGKWEKFNFGGKETKKDYLDRIFSKRLEKIVGFDLKYNQITNDILNYIKDNNFIIIQLRREPTRSFLKNHSNKTQYNLCDILNYSKNIKKEEDKILNYFDNVVIFNYEEITNGRKIDSMPKHIAKKIFDLFKVEEKKLILYNNNKLSVRC